MVTDWMIERKMPQSHWEVLLEQWILTEEEEEKKYETLEFHWRLLK